MCVAVGLLLSGCLDFPALPPVAPPPIQVDQDMISVVVDLTPPQDESVSLPEMELDMEVEMMIERDVEVPLDMTPEADLEMIMDEGVVVENFVITRCVDGALEGSETRFINGQAQSGAPIPCREDGARWLRVDPVSDIPFSTDSEFSPDRERGVRGLSVNLNYTFFFMAREVTYTEYAARCDAPAFPSEPEDRVSGATCRSPDVMSMQNDYCAHQLQPQLNEAVDRGELTAPIDSYQLPMNCVSWEDAAQYCRRIGGRLPSDVEWEVASTYGRQVFPGAWPEGLLLSQELCQYINVNGDGGNRCSPSHPLQLNKIRPTCWGEHNPWSSAMPGYELCDTSGNVAEWVLDDLAEQRPVDSVIDGSPYLSDPHLCAEGGVTEQYKVTRGGNSEVYRNTDLYKAYLTSHGDGICNGVAAVTGFRCVISDQTHGVQPWSEPSTP